MIRLPCKYQQTMVSNLVSKWRRISSIHSIIGFVLGAFVFVCVCVSFFLSLFLGGILLFGWFKGNQKENLSNWGPLEKTYLDCVS